MSAFAWYRTVRIAIPGSDDRPAFGQGVLAELTIQHELVATGLYHGRRRVQFVKKQNALSVLGEEVRRRPLRSAIVPKERQATQIYGIE